MAGKGPRAEAARTFSGCFGIRCFAGEESALDFRFRPEAGRLGAFLS